MRVAPAPFPPNGILNGNPNKPSNLPAPGPKHGQNPKTQQNAPNVEAWEKPGGVAGSVLTGAPWTCQQGRGFWSWD